MHGVQPCMIYRGILNCCRSGRMCYGNLFRLKLLYHVFLPLTDYNYIAPDINYLVLGLGDIIEAPEVTVAPLHSNATFTCTVTGNVFWTVNNFQVSTQLSVTGLAMSGIFVPLSTPGHSEVVVTASLTNNGTNFTCSVEEELGSIAVLNRSEPVQLLVYGKCQSYT